MSSGTPPELSLTHWTVLALLAEQPRHGFAIARELRPDADLGRILTVQRSLVYRALDRLVTASLAEPQQTEPGRAGPTRTVHRVTAAGSAELDAWYRRPVDHVRDLRIGFLIKLRLLQRAGRDPRTLLARQRAALGDTLERLAVTPAEGDVVDLWRRHNARAAAEFLTDLEQRLATADGEAGEGGQSAELS